MINKDQIIKEISELPFKSDELKAEVLKLVGDYEKYSGTNSELFVRKFMTLQDEAEPIYKDLRNNIIKSQNIFSNYTDTSSHRKGRRSVSRKNAFAPSKGTATGDCDGCMDTPKSKGKSKGLSPGTINKTEQSTKEPIESKGLNVDNTNKKRNTLEADATSDHIDPYKPKNLKELKKMIMDACNNDRSIYRRSLEEFYKIAFGGMPDKEFKNHELEKDYLDRLTKYRANDPSFKDLD